MRILVFLLVLANLLFYAYGAGFFGLPDNPDAGRLDRQVAPEKIRIVSRGEAPGSKEEAASPPAASAEAGEVAKENLAETPKVAVEQAKETAATSGAEVKETAKEPAKEASREEAGNACVRWDNLAPGDADQLEKSLRAKVAAARINRQVTPGEGAMWWVHIPPLPGKPEAEKKAGELRRLGVTDYFVQLEPGPNRYAISLGLFSSERGGEDRLAELKGMGVRSARVVLRPGKDAHVALEVSGPAAARTLFADAGNAVKAAAQGCK